MFVENYKRHGDTEYNHFTQMLHVIFMSAAGSIVMLHQAQLGGAMKEARESRRKGSKLSRKPGLIENLMGNRMVSVLFKLIVHKNTWI